MSAAFSIILAFFDQVLVLHAHYHFAYESETEPHYQPCLLTGLNLNSSQKMNLAYPFLYF